MGFTSSLGKRPARLHSSMMGMRLSSINLRVVSRTRRSSSVSKESNSRKSTPRNLMAISFSFLFLRRVHVPNGACELCREPGADTQGVETLEGNKGCEGSQTAFAVLSYHNRNVPVLSTIEMSPGCGSAGLGRRA